MMRKKSDTLHLVLKGKWYDMIASGEKKEEYREIKPYWDKRLRDSYYDKDGNLRNCLHSRRYIVFHKGYTSETMVFENNFFFIGRGKPEWGAPTDKDVYILKLGKRIK